MCNGKLRGKYVSGWTDDWRLDVLDANSGVKSERLEVLSTYGRVEIFRVIGKLQCYLRTRKK